MRRELSVVLSKCCTLRRQDLSRCPVSGRGTGKAAYTSPLYQRNGATARIKSKPRGRTRRRAGVPPEAIGLRRVAPGVNRPAPACRRRQSACGLVGIRQRKMTRVGERAAHFDFAHFSGIVANAAALEDVSTTRQSVNRTWAAREYPAQFPAITTKTEARDGQSFPDLCLIQLHYGSQLETEHCTFRPARPDGA